MRPKSEHSGLWMKSINYDPALYILLSAWCIVFRVQWSLLYCTHSDVLWLLRAFALNIPKCFGALSVRNSPLIPSLPSASITTLLSVAAVERRLPASILKLPPKSWRVAQLLFLCWWDWKLPITLTVTQSPCGVAEEVTYFSLLVDQGMFWLTAGGVEKT